MARSSFQPDPNDFIIVLMGLTGSGKSNLINHFIGQEETHGAHRLMPDTKNVTPYIIHRNGLRIVLVDTPGFDDSYKPDSTFLRDIAHWLTERYPNGTTLRSAGMIYLHRITDKRMSGSVYNNLTAFGRLCGDVPLYRARLVTTMWDTVGDQAAARQRVEELKDSFWGQLISAGAVVKQFDNTPASAQVIMDDLLALRKHGD